MHQLSLLHQRFHINAGQSSILTISPWHCIDLARWCSAFYQVLLVLHQPIVMHEQADKEQSLSSRFPHFCPSWKIVNSVLIYWTKYLNISTHKVILDEALVLESTSAGFYFPWKWLLWQIDYQFCQPFPFSDTFELKEKFRAKRIKAKPKWIWKLEEHSTRRRSGPAIWQPHAMNTNPQVRATMHLIAPIYQPKQHFPRFIQLSDKIGI